MFKTLKNKVVNISEKMGLADMKEKVLLDVIKKKISSKLTPDSLMQISEYGGILAVLIVLLRENDCLTVGKTAALFPAFTSIDNSVYSSSFIEAVAVAIAEKLELMVSEQGEENIIRLVLPYWEHKNMTLQDCIDQVQALPSDLVNAKVKSEAILLLNQ